MKPTEPKRIIGVDEVGRGCLAGPVFTCAARLKSPGAAALLGGLGVTDSKKLTALRREALVGPIKEHCDFAFGMASPTEVDQINILQATFLAMLRALHGLARRHDTLPDNHLVLVDGSFKIPLGRIRDVNSTPTWLDFIQKVEQQSVVQGDATVVEISCASILAKVERDRMMSALEKDYPGYGFANHKGYGSKEHLEAIQALGPTPLHRLTFKGVKEYIRPSHAFGSSPLSSL